MTDIDIDTIATFLEERIDWLEVQAVDATVFGKDHGTDIVIRIDGTYFHIDDDDLTSPAEMAEYWATRLESLAKTAQRSAAAKIRKQRTAVPAASTKINAAVSLPRRSAYPSW